jgi:phosphoribosylamine--glycine ligase
MGDPETEVVIPRIKSDLMDLFIATAKNDLENTTIEIDDRSATTVMLVSGGYPEAYEKNKVITGIEEVSNSLVFHAGTAMNKQKDVLTNGGRVIAVTSYGRDFREALETSYKNVDKIQFEGKNFRTDIGFDL